MNNSRWLGRQLAEGKPLYVLPPISDDAAPALKDALATRNAASTTGRCACGAEGRVTGPDGLGIMHLAFEHEPGCPASDENLDRLVQAQRP